METKGISLEEFNKLDKAGVQLIDIRGVESAEYGLIPGAVNIPKELIIRGDLKRYLDKRHTP